MMGGMTEIAPLAAKALARPAADGVRGWWAARQDRRKIALRLPPVSPHTDCQDGPHAGLGVSRVSNWSRELVFDVQLHLPGADGDELATVTKPVLMPGEEWRFDWSERRGSGAAPLLRPDEDGRYGVEVDLLWADAPGGPLWKRVADGKVKRAPGHQGWRRAHRTVRGCLPGSRASRALSRE